MSACFCTGACKTTGLCPNSRRTTGLRDVYDVEVAMQAFRMMRDGGYRKADPLFEDLKAEFPDVPAERLRQIMVRLCRRLLEDGA
jgi:hypothetical protein